MTPNELKWLDRVATMVTSGLSVGVVWCLWQSQQTWGIAVFGLFILAHAISQGIHHGRRRAESSQQAIEEAIERERKSWRMQLRRAARSTEQNAHKVGEHWKEEGRARELVAVKLNLIADTMDLKAWLKAEGIEHDES